MPEPPDLELLSRWQAGDSRAGDELASRYFLPLRAYFLTKVPSDYEDLVSATFLRLVSKREGFRGESSFRVYLFGIARMIMLEHFKARRHDHRFEPLRSSVAELELGRLSSFVGARERHRLLIDALRRLELHEQELVELYYWQGLSAREIAELQGGPEATIRSRIRAVLKRLAKHYAELERRTSAEPAEPDEVEGWMRELQASLDQFQVEHA